MAPSETVAKVGEYIDRLARVYCLNDKFEKGVTKEIGERFLNSTCFRENCGQYRLDG